MPSDDLIRHFMKETENRLNKIDINVERLLRFRWMLIGAGIMTSIIVSVLWEAAKAIAGGR
jgi:hypothetical protein